MSPTPPPSVRTQRAADALLATASLGSRSLAAATKQSASITAARCQQQLQNPYHQPRKMGASGSMKRPLASIRGTNDSTTTVNSSNFGGGISGMNSKLGAAASTVKATTNSSNKSAFDRRNARDKISKKEAPPTFTDLNLLAMLDGPKKKVKKPVRIHEKSWQQQHPPSVHPPIPLPQKRSNSSSASSQCLPSEKRQKSTNNDVMVVAPPPIRSYGGENGNRHGSGTRQPAAISKPRKRICSHQFVTHSKSDVMRRNGVDSRQASTERGGGIDRVVEGSSSSCNARLIEQGNDYLVKPISTDGMDSSKNGDENTTTSSKVSETSTHIASTYANEKRQLDGVAEPSLTRSILEVSNLSSVSDRLPKTNQANDSNEDQDGAATETMNGTSNILPLSIGGANKRNKSKPPVGFRSISANVRRNNNRQIPSLADSKAVRDPANQLTHESLVDLPIGGKDISVSDDTSNDALQSESVTSGDGGHSDIDNNSSKHADWFDLDELATIEKTTTANKNAVNNDAALLLNESEEPSTSSRSRNNKSRGQRGQQGGDVNDNFVRLDLRNAAGSCRGARNLKKVNKQKLWRAQNRFGMNDTNVNNLDSSDGREGGGGVGGVGGGMDGSMHQNRSFGNHERGGYRRDKRDSGDIKCFSALQNAGVDPLDDYVDGVFSKRNDKSTASSNGGRNGTDESALMRDGSIPICTRHQRPCKLMTVKKNNKGNKGRKYFVCSMPKGEQCNFFKWEEDTVEATQMALLKSSSNSGFIARQVAAAKTRFKELTVPELRIEAKQRGLKAVGKKDQILTRLLIWTRDEIANSVEPSAVGNDVPPESEASAEEDKEEEYYDDDDDEDADDECVINHSRNQTECIDLSDDESSCDDESRDGDSTTDELEICRETSASRSVSTLHNSLETYFGYTAFREGQEWAIRRCLSHEQTLLVAPTGQGKSLCYALPAVLMDGICLVVSPLISLMQDQLRQLPPKIPAATLSGSMTVAQMALIVDDIMRGRYKVLFVSPERLASAAFRRLVRPKFNVETRKYEQQFPTVSLLCVDEAHCLSQWGHNFRPSYLRVKSLLPLIKPKSILALTATAGPTVVRDICHTLCIPFAGHEIDTGDCPPLPNMLESCGVKVLSCDRDNIDVFSIILQSNDERRYLLHKILKAKSKESNSAKKLPIEEGCLSKGSVIIYVWRQKDTEIVAEQLNGAGISGGVVCYHGGMDAGSRSRAQSKFLRGKARICVATVAFGLGINKPDITGVIHLCLPPSPEHYLQEIGRAGRDGRAAKAIALPLQDEFVSRHSLAHSDRLSRSQLDIVFLALQKLVNEAIGDIPPEALVDLDADELCVDELHVALPVAQTVNASDCKEESIETILSILEGETLSGETMLSVEGYLPDAATITLKKRNLEKLGKLEVIAQSIAKCGIRVDEQHDQSTQGAVNSTNMYQGNFGGTAMEKGFYAYSFGTYKFSVVRCASCMGPNMEPRHVYAALRRLQGNGELELVLDTTSNGRALHLRVKQYGLQLFRSKRRNSGDTSQEHESMNVLDNDVEAIATKLSTQFSEKVSVSVGKVVSMYEIMHRVSCNDTNAEEAEDEIMDECDDDDTTSARKSPRLVTFQKMIHNYFLNRPLLSPKNAPEVIKDFPIHDTRPMSFLTADVTSLLQVLALRPQEQLPMAVRINDPECSDYRDLCLAKILHSIDSPRAPILGWYNHFLWGKYRSYSFSSVVQAVKMTFDNS